MKLYFVYILASKRNGTLYIGVTSDLIKRVYQHKISFYVGFTSKYKVNKLVYFEDYYKIDDAIIREKRLKKWKREWKLELINNFNKEWSDLYYDIIK